MSSNGLDDRERAAATEALTDWFDTLVESPIGSDWLARKLFSNKIIALNEMQRAIDVRTRETEIDRRQYLMLRVITKTQEDIQCFRKFLDILDLDDAYSKYPTEIRKCYRE